MTPKPAFRRPLTATVLGLAALFPVLAAPQGAAAAVRYSGRTSQRRAVSLTLSNRRTSVLRFSLAFRAACQNGELNSGVETSRIAVRRGVFRAPGSATVPLDGGLSARTQINAGGRIGAGAVTGTFRLTATIMNAQGQPLDTCSTGTVRYRATRR